MSNDIPEALFKRMVLANQYRILSFLDVDQDDFWQRAADKMIQGWPVEDLPDVEIMQSYMRDALTRQDQHFVLDALQVFALLQDGTKKGYQHKRGNGFTQFPGFDAINEAKLLFYARHIVENEHRFEAVERSAENFDAHMPMVDMYQRMISAWERLGRQWSINETLFDALIDAQTHPS